MERLAGGRDSKPLSDGDLVQTSGGEPFGVIEFAKTERLFDNPRANRTSDYITGRFG